MLQHLLLVSNDQWSYCKIAKLKSAESPNAPQAWASGEKFAESPVWYSKVRSLLASDSGRSEKWWTVVDCLPDRGQWSSYMRPVCCHLTPVSGHSLEFFCWEIQFWPLTMDGRLQNDWFQISVSFQYIDNSLSVFWPNRRGRQNSFMKENILVYNESWKLLSMSLLSSF